MKEKQRKMLLDLRSQLVGKLHTQPFTVYQDSVIEELLKAQPKTLKDLSKVKGFPEGGKRLEGFGEAVIAIFNATDKVDKFEVITKGGAPALVTKLKSLDAF